MASLNENCFNDLAVIDRGIILAKKALEKENKMEFEEAGKLYTAALQAYYDGKILINHTTQISGK